MAVFQKEAGLCTGRGFDAAGYCGKFMTWVTKSAVSGGPGWYVLLDRSANPVSTTFTVPDHTNDRCYSVAHGLLTGEIVQVSTTTTLPAGLSAATDYYVINVDADNFKLATSLTNSLAGTAINITSAGTGTHRFLMEGPYIVVSDASSPTANQVCKILKVGFKTSEAAYVRVQYCLSFNTTNKILYGYWGGKHVSTVDAGDFAYDFRGGAECMILQSRISSSWSNAIIDEWTGDANFVEGIDKAGTLQSGITSGSNIVLQLGAGQASNFTVNKYYYIYDFQDHSWVNYCMVTARDTGTDQITVDTLYYNFPSGSIIGAYPHRFYCTGSSTTFVNIARFNKGLLTRIPYYSSTAGWNYVFVNNQNDICQGGVELEFNSTTLSRLNSDEYGYQACQRGLIIEKYRDGDQSTSGMNRAYGSPKNLFVYVNNGYAAGQDGKTINGKNYLFFITANIQYTTGNGGYCVGILDSSATS